MQILLETQHISLPRNSRQALIGRIRRIFSHAAQHVHSLQVQLRSTNTFRGGVDKLCTVRAKLADGSLVVIHERNTHLATALYQGVRLTRKSILRTVMKRRSLRANRAGRAMRAGSTNHLKNIPEAGHMRERDAMLEAAY